MKITFYSRFIYLLLFIASFSACKKKESEDNSPFASQYKIIQGTWVFKNEKEEFYNSSNVKVWEVNDNDEDIVQVIVKDKNLTFIQKPGNPSVNLSYEIFDNVGKISIRWYDQAGTRAPRELSTLTNTNMDWMTVSPSSSYKDNAGVSRNAAYSKVYTQFTK